MKYSIYCDGDSTHVEFRRMTPEHITNAYQIVEFALAIYFNDREPESLTKEHDHWSKEYHDAEKAIHDIFSTLPQTHNTWGLSTSFMYEHDYRREQESSDAWKNDGTDPVEGSFILKIIG